MSDLSFVFSETPLDSHGSGLQDTTSSGVSDITITLPTVSNRFGLWINGGNTATSWTFTASNGATVVGSETFSFAIFNGFPDPSTFAGIEFAQAFDSVRIQETAPNGQYTNIDDIRFEQVPEPSSAILFGVTALGVTLNRRRRY